MLLEAKLDTPWHAPEGMGKYLKGTDVVDLTSDVNNGHETYHAATRPA